MDRTQQHEQPANPPKMKDDQHQKINVKILTDLETAISSGNINNLKKLSSLLDEYGSTYSLILACKHNKVKVLEYLLDSKNVTSDYSIPMPFDEDEEHHTAIYYAIRSGSSDLLDTLINKWPDNYFASHLNELDEALSKAYQELKLKNVLLSNEIEMYVEHKLIDLRFYSNTPRQTQDTQRNIQERIQLILDNINSLQNDYSVTIKVDATFIFIAKSLAQNIHVLKRQLKSTYLRLPWEEMEFCLFSFVSGHTKQQEINLFYLATLTTTKILIYLKHFANNLRDIRDNINNGYYTAKLDELPKLQREKIVSDIIRSYPEFEDLYNDHKEIRDIHSLNKINDYVKLALAADGKGIEGRLIITRVLQVIGEYLKNTLESPKLSNITSEILILSLPKNAKKIIVDLRNCLSHAYSLSKRIEITDNESADYFVQIQNDMKRIGDAINEILFNSKLKAIRILLQQIIDSTKNSEIKEINKIFNNVQRDTINDFNTMEPNQLAKLLKELSENVTDMTHYEMELLTKLNNVYSNAESHTQNITLDYNRGLELLITLNQSVIFDEDDLIIGHNINITRERQFLANQILKMVSPKIKPKSLEEIADLSMKISHSVLQRQTVEKTDNVIKICYEIFHIVTFGVDDIKWIEKLRKQLKEKVFSTASSKQNKSLTRSVEQEHYNNHLTKKLLELKTILEKNSLSALSNANMSHYKTEKKLQVAIEMLVLDIMSILSNSKHNLEDNLLYLDDNSPLLTGKYLRNHLAHDNILIDILLTDPSLAIIINAKKLTEENIMISKQKLGAVVSGGDPSKLREKYDKGFAVVTNQTQMFEALEKGNFEVFNDCLKMGADINARSIDSMTTLHFAAKGSSLEIVKFLLHQNISVNIKDINNQNPFHVAAAYGRTDIVEYFIKQTELFIDEPGPRGKTALHVAALNGHKDTVDVLLKHKANYVVHDSAGLPPLHYAIYKNHVSVAKTLLKKDANVDINESNGGFTALHRAAERGCLELVNFLLQNNADANMKNDRDWTPIHAAALKGYLEVVNVLILNGADVNARNVNGCSALHYAIEFGYTEIAAVLLKHGTDVNVIDKIYYYTPLHYAVRYGHEQIVILLLKNKANANMTTVTGLTPLHLAAQGGHAGIAAILLQSGIQIDAKDQFSYTPLHYAIDTGKKEVAEMLINNKAHINAIAIVTAAAKGHYDIVNVLIRNNAGIEATDADGFTPLHVAAQGGHTDICDLLIQNKAVINVQSSHGFTPLFYAAGNGCIDVVKLLIKHKATINISTSNETSKLIPMQIAVAGGHTNVVKFLIENNADVNSPGLINYTALHGAVEMCHKEIVEILVANGADVNAICNGETPLLSAVKRNNKEIVEILLKNGASVNEKNGDPLFNAVIAGFEDIVDILLKYNARVDLARPTNMTILHSATLKGSKAIINTLIAKGADINAQTTNIATPLHQAVSAGNEDALEALLENGADVNGNCIMKISPLHSAAIYGYNNVAEILLKSGANIKSKDSKNRTPAEFAVENGHMQVMKTILQYYSKDDINAKCNDDWTLLHMATPHLEIVKYLVEKGADMYAKNAAGSQPIHIAAREGYQNSVEFFLSKGVNINSCGAANQTLLHYAAIKGHLDVAKFFIDQGANVNIKDNNGQGPMHIAAIFGFSDVVDLLLKNGAMFSDTDHINNKALDLATDQHVIKLLTSTEKLFEVVKGNRAAEVEKYIKAGAYINARNADGGTPLHYASWQGYDKIVTILLQNKANPNLFTNKGFTPLHYAVKFSHFTAVKSLLSNGAMYNASSKGGKIPADYSVDKSITDLIKLVSDSFENIKNGNTHIINNLEKIKDIDTLKLIIRARNSERKTLVAAAMHNNFPKVEQLKEIGQGDLSKQIHIAVDLLDRSNYQQALDIFQTAFERRREILGPDNPGTLDIQVFIARAQYKQGVYIKALNSFEEIAEKYTEILGVNDRNALKTKGLAALTLHRLGRQDEALSIYQELYAKQKEILGPHDSDTLETQFHMALVLDNLSKFDEALELNREAYNITKKLYGENYPNVVSAQNNLALILSHQDKFDEALEIYNEVYEKKQVILGAHHADTLRTAHHIAVIYIKQNKYNQALKMFRDVLNIQKRVLGLNNPDTLTTQVHIAGALAEQGKSIAALKAFQECSDRIKTVFGPNHAHNKTVTKYLNMINLKLKLFDENESQFFQYLQNDINVTARNGNTEMLKQLLENGADANQKDIDGRTPLHFAVSSKQINAIKMLLKNGGDATEVTNKGNTPLHTAASKGSNAIVKILLQNFNGKIINDFINAKTTSSGSTALHVSAKNGALDIVKTLLMHGAIYNVKNKDDETPLDIAVSQHVIDFLTLIDELFSDAKSGKEELIHKLTAAETDIFNVATNTRNSHGFTLLQIVIANKHKSVANKLLQMLRN